MPNTELGAINTEPTGGTTPVQDGNFQLYTYTFTAGQSLEYLSFLFRNDPAGTVLDDVSLVRQGDGTDTNLVADGGFESGGQAAEPAIPVGWNAIGTQGLDSAGQVSTGYANTGQYSWVDGAVGGYDGISQQLALTQGASYTLTFDLAIYGNAGADEIDTQVWMGPTAEAGHLACFAVGTKILTARGEVAVESVRVGDHAAALHRGGFAKVRWVGHRRLTPRAHPRPWDVQPVRIAAHAFGPGRPCRDLRVSPDHAIYADGALFRARDLLNGATIVQQDVAQITYFHIELDAHDVLLADGLAAESFLDTGNRTAFANSGGAVQAHADFARRVWDTASCVPPIWHGPALRALRCRLQAEAEAQGWRLEDDAAPHVVAGDQVVHPTPCDGVLAFALPAGATEIVLHSRASVPAEVLPAGDDARVLGLAVVGLALDGVAVPLDDARLGAGWHVPEGAGLRWTDGAARIRVDGASCLAVTVTPLLRYWQAPETRMAAAA